MNFRTKAGIASIGINLPPLYISVEELAKLRGVDPNKFTQGLGCKEIALCSPDYGVAELALKAAQRALSRWNGDKSSIGMIVVGTESALDMSRPLSAWVADKLDLTGNIRSYEVKHACYGGTVGVRQATEWKLAGIYPDKAALVIAADISAYKPGDPGEPTGGAGAVAMIIDKPLIAEVEPLSFPWSKPVFDFWRPVGDLYPSVQGELSLASYKEAAQECFKGLIQNQNIEDVLNQFQAICFHTPFPKMVKKAFYSVCEMYGWNEEKINKYFNEKVEPTMDWNKTTGNSYTASLWFAVAKSLCGLKESQKIAAFSYGSGCGAELLTLQAGPLAEKAEWMQDYQQDIQQRKEVSGDIYTQMAEARTSA